jgi:hypothetical protein
VTRRVLALVLGFGALAACSSSSTAPAGTNPDAAPPADAGPDTWATYAQGFFATYCVSCHGAQDPTGRDFTVQANVETNKLVIRCGVAVTQDPSWSCASLPAAKQFPIGNGPKPSDAERGRIVAWITAGAL